MGDLDPDGPFFLVMIFSIFRYTKYRKNKYPKIPGLLRLPRDSLPLLVFLLSEGTPDSKPRDRGPPTRHPLKQRAEPGARVLRRLGEQVRKLGEAAARREEPGPVSAGPCWPRGQSLPLGSALLSV